MPVNQRRPWTDASHVAIDLRAPPPRVHSTSSNWFRRKCLTQRIAAEISKSGSTPLAREKRR